MRAIIYSLAVAACAAAAPSAQADIYGLHVGVNAYHNTTDLRGAVDDARDIAAALDAFGAVETTLLLNKDANRTAIKAHWERLIDQADQGDVIVFSYAGHAGKEDDVNGDELENGSFDTQDETLVLSDYRPFGPGLNERIVDDELNLWFRSAIAKGASVVFVADACLSGSMSRNGGPGNRVAASVNANAQREGADPGVSRADSSEPEPNAAGAEVFFLSATAQDSPVLETSINGQWRGVLSYVFARALGDADTNNDGVLMRDELAEYVHQTARSVDDTGQSRARLDGGGQDRVVLRRAAATVLERVSQSNNRRPNTRGGIALQIRPAAAHINVDRARIVTRDPRLVFDANTGDMWDHEGSQIAEGLNETRLQHVINKYYILDIVKNLVERSSLKVAITPEQRTYSIGDRPFLTMGPSDHAYLLVFNLASNGEVQQVYPYYESEFGPVSLNRNMTIQAEVKSPIGADHLIALSSASELTSLRQAVKNGRHPLYIQSLLDPLLDRDDVSAGMLSFYTQEH